MDTCCTLMIESQSKPPALQLCAALKPAPAPTPCWVHAAIEDGEGPPEGSPATCSAFCDRLQCQWWAPASRRCQPPADSHLLCSATLPPAQILSCITWGRCRGRCISSSSSIPAFCDTTYQLNLLTTHVGCSCKVEETARMHTAQNAA